MDKRNYGGDLTERPENDEEYDVIDEQMLIDFHLGNAINLDTVEKLVKDKDPGYKLYVPGYDFNSWRDLKDLIPSSSELEIGFLFPTCKMLTFSSTRSVMNVSTYKEIVDIVSRALKERGIDIPMVNYSQRLINEEILVRTTHLDIFHNILMAISNLSEILRGGSRKVYSAVSRNGDFISVTLLKNIYPIKLIVGRNLCALVDLTENKSYIGNYDSVLLLMDTVGQRMCLDIGLQFSRIGNVSGAIDLESVERVILWGDQLLEKTGNLGYEIIGMFEPLVTSIILVKNNDIIGRSGEFYDNCTDELIEILSQFDNREEIIDIWSKIIQEILGYPNDWLSNLFSIYRIWGHPRVNILEGMRKVFDKGTAVKDTLGRSALMALYQFRHMFLQSYLRRHKMYPRLEIKRNDSYVTKKILSGAPVDESNKGFCIIDYQDIEILQIWDIPESYDTCHLLHDKAVSPNRSELFDSIRSGKGAVSGTNRRGLIRWMEGESIKCKEFLSHIDEEGLDEDSLIIGMYEKEREIKVKARMFSLMSEKMRMYFVLTEELISNHILPYFPEITMKDPLNVQIRKIWKVGGSGIDSLSPNINIDFEKWNLNMREEFTDGLFDQMDKMFGFRNLVSRTHEIFKKSLIYSSSGKYLPICTTDGFITDPPMLYMNHQGGFEGLRQKGWTVATVCLLAYTASQQKLNVSLLGQGDNQVVKLHMPTGKWEHLCYSQEAKERESRKITDEFIDEMDRNFRDAGLPIKVRETWISTRLFMYGKSMYLDGNCLPQWNKKLLRSYAMSNEGTLTISGVVGTIATNLSASSSVSDSPDIMYVIYLFLAEWSLRYLFNYHPFTRETLIPGSTYEFSLSNGKKKEKHKTKPLILSPLIVTLLTVPTAIGGSVTIPLTGFFMRGFPDHASEGYAWMKLLYSVDSKYRELFINWYSFLKNPTVEADMLIQSPWSLNHRKPPTPGLQSREMVRQWLLSGRFPRNKFLRNMSQINKYFDRKKVCEELLSEVMNPLISYEIFQSFPQTYYDSILRRFEGTRSVRKLAMKESYTEPIVSKLMELEKRYTYYLFWRGSKQGTIFSLCATSQARQARDIGWGRKIIGLTTPHPIEFLHDSICVGYPDRCEGDDFILAKYYPNGRFAPYLGSRVKTKVASLQDEAAKTEPLVKTCAGLARYLKWLNLGENLFNVIKRSAESVCQTDIYENFFDFDDESQNYSGSIEHRFNPAAASSGCFINYMPQLGCQVYMSGDHMPKFGKGKENYTLHFQAIYCYLQYLTAKSPKGHSVHYHLRCESCIVPCEEKIEDIRESHPWIDKAFSEDSLPLLRDTIGYIQKRVSSNSRPDTGKIVGLITNPSSDMTTSQRVYKGVMFLLSLKCALNMTCRRGDLKDSLGIADLQHFPRVYAYKIFVDQLIRMVASWMIFLHGITYDKIPTGYNLTSIKKKIKRNMDSASLEMFSFVGSLCVGRCVEDSGEISPIICSGYPESVSDLLIAVKRSLIKEIDLTNQIHNFLPGPFLLPQTGMTPLEQRVILGFFAYTKYKCWNCAMIGSRTSPLLTTSCRGNHMSMVLTKVQIIPYSLDRAVKLMTLKRQGLHKRVSIPFCGSARIKPFISAEDIRDSEIALTGRKISLPTASVYKWVSVLSICELDIAQHVIILGDGTGGTSLVCSAKWKDAIIHPMAKLERFDVLPQDTVSIIPLLARGLENLNTDFLESLGDDITADRWTEDFVSAVSSLEGNVVVISDIEGCPSDSIKDVMIKLSRSRKVIIINKIYEDSEWYISNGWTHIVTPHANLHYGESFVSNLRSWTEVEYITLDINSERVMIEHEFDHLVKITRELVERHLGSLLINIPASQYYSQTTNFVKEMINYVNIRYRFHQDRLKEFDDRNLSDGMIIKLNKALNIFLRIHLSEDSNVLSTLQNIGLIRRTGGERKRFLSKYRIIFSETKHSVTLNAKDVIVLKTLRSYNHIRVNCDTIEDIYNKLMI